MAANSSSSPVQRKDAKSHARIRCKNQQSVDSITETVLGEVDIIIQRNAHWSDEEKSRVQKRFREIYTGVTAENITVGECSQRSSSENRNELLWNMDDNIVMATDKRKRYPRLCVQQMALQCKNECSLLTNQPVVVPKNFETSVLPNQPGITEDTKNLYRKASENLTSMSKALTMAVDRTEKLHESIKMKQQMSSSRTDNVLFHPDKEETNVPNSPTPLRKKMKETNVTKQSDNSHTRDTTSSPLKLHCKGYRLRNHNHNIQKNTGFYKKI